MRTPALLQPRHTVEVSFVQGEVDRSLQVTFEPPLPPDAFSAVVSNLSRGALTELSGNAIDGSYTVAGASEPQSILLQRLSRDIQPGEPDELPGDKDILLMADVELCFEALLAQQDRFAMYPTLSPYRTAIAALRRRNKIPRPR